MSILGKYTENTSNSKELLKNKHNDGEFKMPAVTREDKDCISLKKAMVISSILHPTAIGSLWLILTILAFFGITFAIFEKPKPKINDIEFVLVDKEDTPLNKNTKYRADRNSRTGGINDPKKPVSMPSANPAKKPQPSSPAPAPKKKTVTDRISQPVTPKKQVTQTPSATTPQKNVQPATTPQQAIPKPQAARPAPPTERPSVRPTNTPKPVPKPSGTPFRVPVPTGGTQTGQYSTGPIAGSGSAAKGGSTGGGTYAPNPSLAPIGSGSGSKTNGSGSAGSGTGSGYGRSGSGSGGGNPGGGGGRPGIDAIREPDFGPYMRELQRRIKMNWDPPKGNESKRVVLLFKIAKDGRLLNCSVFKSSGLQNADKAALNAVQLAAPFRPLPPEFKGQSIDIQFTFDYNVFGATKY
ncbi:MAG: TonB family protein [Cyanobacteria bacterium SIG26]|nr:TonB family protein [Cyanobacteria bacterium SIG26]